MENALQKLEVRVENYFLLGVVSTKIGKLWDEDSIGPRSQPDRSISCGSGGSGAQ